MDDPVRDILISCEAQALVVAVAAAVVAGLYPAWQTNQVYFAHLAVTDVMQDQFMAEERWSRGAVGLAAAEAGPYRVWLDDWRVAAMEDEGGGWPGGDGG